MNLSVAEQGKEYIIKEIKTDDEELNSFLFSLGCYSGEPITVISKLKGSLIVAIKDGRYKTLLIYIGDGTGSNWWGSIYEGVITMDSKDKIKYEWYLKKGN